MASEHSLGITPRAATSGWSPHSGRQTRGTPCARAFITVPWPHCDTRAATWGNLRVCGTNAVTTTFGGELARQPEVSHSSPSCLRTRRQRCAKGSCTVLKSVLNLPPSRRRHCHAICQPNRRQPLRTLLSAPHIPVGVSGRWVVPHPLLAGRGAFACQCRTHRPRPQSCPVYA
jgi:hypothetical protein